jgi:hypothetical protein
LGEVDGVVFDHVSHEVLDGDEAVVGVAGGAAPFVGGECGEGGDSFTSEALEAVELLVEVHCEVVLVCGEFFLVVAKELRRILGGHLPDTFDRALFGVGQVGNNLDDRPFAHSGPTGGGSVEIAHERAENDRC